MDKSGKLFIRPFHCVCRELLSVQYCAACLPLLPVNILLVNSVPALLRSHGGKKYASCVGNRGLAVVAPCSGGSLLSILRECSAAACGKVRAIVDRLIFSKFALFPREPGGFGEAELLCELLFVQEIRRLCLNWDLAGRATCTEVWVLKVQAW